MMTVRTIVAVALMVVAIVATCYALPVMMEDDETGSLNLQVPINSITLYLVASDAPLDWGSPGNLVRTTLRNYASSSRRRHPHPIGHVFVQIRCRNDLAEREELVAVTGGGASVDLREFAFGGRGFGLLLQDFPGRMMESEEIVQELQSTRRIDRIRKLTFLTVSQTCKRALDFASLVKSYKLYEKFNALRRPRLREGAGCISFAIDVLEVIGVPVGSEEWSRSVAIPTALIAEGGREVNAFQLLFGEHSSRWARYGEPQFNLRLPDPSLAVEWFDSVSNSSRLWIGKEDMIGRLRKIAQFEIQVDIRDLPTPVEPLFLK